jgi:hypothetical protein
VDFGIARTVMVVTGVGESGRAPQQRKQRETKHEPVEEPREHSRYMDRPPTAAKRAQCRSAGNSAAREIFGP